MTKAATILLILCSQANAETLITKTIAGNVSVVQNLDSKTCEKLKIEALAHCWRPDTNCQQWMSQGGDVNFSECVK